MYWEIAHKYKLKQRKNGMVTQSFLLFAFQLLANLIDFVMSSAGRGLN